MQVSCFGVALRHGSPLLPVSFGTNGEPWRFFLGASTTSTVPWCNASTEDKGKGTPPRGCFGRFRHAGNARGRRGAKSSIRAAAVKS